MGDKSEVEHALISIATSLSEPFFGVYIGSRALREHHVEYIKRVLHTGCEGFKGVWDAPPTRAVWEDLGWLPKNARRSFLSATFVALRGGIPCDLV